MILWMHACCYSNVGIPMAVLSDTGWMAACTIDVSPADSPMVGAGQIELLNAPLLSMECTGLSLIVYTAYLSIMIVINFITLVICGKVFSVECFSSRAAPETRQAVSKMSPVLHHLSWLMLLIAINGNWLDEELGYNQTVL